MNKLTTILLSLLGLGTNMACSHNPFASVDVPTFAEFINNDVQLVDVRTASEYAEGHLEGAINIDVKQTSFIEQAQMLLDPSRPVAVYCRSGRRSASAADQLSGAGYEVTNLKGGVLAWHGVGKPLTTDTTEIDVFRTPGGKVVRFHALVHSSIRIDYDGRVILVDPVRQLGNRQVDYSSVPEAEYILVTHEHHDHFDLPLLQQLIGDETRFITNARCAELLGQGEVMANGDTLQLANEITLEAVPAYNTTESHMQFHPQGRDNGYVLTLDGLRIYIAGDTEDIPEMAALQDIDIAFLPCNQPYTMTTDQVLSAARLFRPRVLFPYHYSQTDVSGLREQLKVDSIDVRIRHYE